MTDLAKQMFGQWEQTRANWARSLFNEFPAGLGPKPNFAIDEQARLIWTNKGWGEYMVESACVGTYPKVRIGDKVFPEDSLKSLSQAQQIEVAGYAFDDAQRLWEQEKAKADETEKETRAHEMRIAELQRNLNEGTARVSQINTTAGLKIEEEALSKKIESASTDESIFLHKLLRIVQSRMIEIEQESNRKATRLAWIGIVLAVVFGIVSILTWLYPLQ